MTHSPSTLQPLLPECIQREDTNIWLQLRKKNCRWRHAQSTRFVHSKATFKQGACTEMHTYTYTRIHTLCTQYVHAVSVCTLKVATWSAHLSRVSARGAGCASGQRVRGVVAITVTCNGIAARPRHPVRYIRRGQQCMHEALAVRPIHLSEVVRGRCVSCCPAIAIAVLRQLRAVIVECLTNQVVACRERRGEGKECQAETSHTGLPVPVSVRLYA